MVYLISNLRRSGLQLGLVVLVCAVARRARAPRGRAADHHQRQHGARRRPPARHTRRAAAAAAAGTAATSPGAIERQLGWELRAAVPADGPAEWPAGPGLMSI